MLERSELDGPAGHEDGHLRFVAAVGPGSPDVVPLSLRNILKRTSAFRGTSDVCTRT